jgi:sortase system peptidoglycan-associated protein
MKTKLIISALTLSLLTSTLSTDVMANENADEHAMGKYEEQRVGTGIGMFIGTVLGGPIGLVVAGYIGNKVGESEGEGEELVTMQKTVTDTHQELARVKAEQTQQNRLAQQRMQAMQQQYVDRQIQYEQQMAVMHSRTVMEKSLDVSLQFRTGSSDIESVYQQQLVELAKVMKNLKQYSLDLSGYADRQGEEKFNQALSQSRADAVKNFLVGQGIDASRISTKAYGESLPLENEQTAQSDFFDRRVMMKLSPGTSAVAKN